MRATISAVRSALMRRSFAFHRAPVEHLKFVLTYGFDSLLQNNSKRHYERLRQRTPL
jgi:hypothetical protein